MQGASPVVLYLPAYRWPFSLCATNEKSYAFKVSAAGCEVHGELHLLYSVCTEGGSIWSLSEW